MDASVTIKIQPSEFDTIRTALRERKYELEAKGKDMTAGVFTPAMRRDFNADALKLGLILEKLQ